MRSPLPLALISLFAIPFALGGCSTFEAPTPLESVHWTSVRDTLGVSVSADETAVIARMSGPSPGVWVYDGDLNETESVSGIGSYGFARGGDLALRVDVQEVETLAPPDMALVSRIDDEGLLDHNSIILADPRADRWVVVNQDFRKGVYLVDQATGSVARTLMWDSGYVRAAAIDDQTGLLVAVGRGGRITVARPGTGQVVQRLQVADRDLGYDVAAAGGRAWIATSDNSGAVLELDLETFTIAREFELGLTGGSPSVSCSPSRTHLAVACSGRAAGSSQSITRIVVYEIEPGGLSPIAKTDTSRAVGESEIALMSIRGVVLLACGRRGLLAWRYGADR